MAYMVNISTIYPFLFNESMCEMDRLWNNLVLHE